MRRWNGWGEQSTTYPLPAAALEYLERLAGQGHPATDAGFPEVVAAIPATRLPAHPLVKGDACERLLHARGQSLPDWVALRSGRIGVTPDGVAYPHSDADVRQLLSYTRQAGACLIPYGGGTSVVGHINPLPGDRPVLTVDLAHMRRLLDLNVVDRLATFEAGVRGPDLEQQLNRHGFTLGHFPQSFEHSTLGGWIATRSTGQQSYFYGRIEDLFAGGRLETPEAPLDLRPLPASAAGPDLRQLVLGSEGRLGILTRACMRIQPLPEVDEFYGVFFPDWESGAAAVRAIAQARLPISMARLSDPVETETTLALAGKECLVGLARRGLRLAGYGARRCLLVFGVIGDRKQTAAARAQVARLLRRYGGLQTGRTIGNLWRKARFYTPYLRNTLWEYGYALDTLETALRWSEILPTAAQARQALHSALVAAGGGGAPGGLVFAHLSHIYHDGASLYVTYLFPRSPDPDETLATWRAAKAAASRVILAHGGTISHQHGIGSDHAAYLVEEKGPAGLAWLAAACRAADPDGILNPGKLLE